jgi:hypothetical protein
LSSSFDEFLTHQTTCASEMLEKTPRENFCKKDLLWVAASMWPGVEAAGMHGSMPPHPLAAGSMPPPPLAAGGRARAMPPPPLVAGQGQCRHPHWRQVARQGPGLGPRHPAERRRTCRRCQRRQGPAGTGPGGTCRSLSLTNPNQPSIVNQPLLYTEARSEGRRRV